MRPNTFLDELLVISLVYTIIMIKDKKKLELEAEMIMLVSDDGEANDENDG